MELIVSLILPAILITPLLWIVGRKVVNFLSSNEVDAVSKSNRDVKLAHDSDIDQRGKNTAIYDGMVTVEIPVLGKQVIAYEPLPDAVLGEEEKLVGVPVFRSSHT